MQLSIFKRIIFSLAIFLVAGCADITRVRNEIDRPPTQNGVVSQDFWAGRISLQVQSEPPQAFFASFELKGHIDNGELVLISPLGSILGVMRWTRASATLEQGGNIRTFASTDDLLLQATGAVIPLSALFDWLRGVNTVAPGWIADLTQQSSGRIAAQRTSPAPTAHLRIVLGN